jgi:hypothetical protein
MKGITPWDAPIAINAEQLKTLEGLIHRFGKDLDREERTIKSIGVPNLDSLSNLPAARYNVLVQRLRKSNKDYLWTCP